MRKFVKKPATLHAQELIIKKLLNFKGDSNLILNKSIENSWQDVYELNTGGNNGKSYTGKGNFGVNRGLSREASDRADEIEREYAIKRELEVKEASTAIQNCLKHRNDNQRDNDHDRTGNDNETS
jgi:hypothetical protein